MPRGRSRRGEILRGAALVALVAPIVAGSGGCEVLVGGDVPDFECVPGPAVCPGDEVCDPMTHQCVAPCARAGCPSGFVCDPGSNACVPPDSGADDTSPTGETGPDTAGGGAETSTNDAPMVDRASAPDVTADAGCHGLTCPCSGAAECTSGICADSATVPSALYAAAQSQSFCTMPCCTSGDCEDGTVCFATGGTDSVAGNFCVAPGWLGRVAPGPGAGGASCATGSDCRSGLCSGSTCADTCCSTAQGSTECVSGECRFGTFPGAIAWDDNFVASCGRSGTRANGAACTSDSECASYLCVSSACTSACRTTSECTGAAEACTYIIPPSEPNATIAGCFTMPPNMTPGTAVTGDACMLDTDCASLFCDPAASLCTDVCFTDADCSNGWRCRPEEVTLSSGGKFTALFCGT